MATRGRKPDTTVERPTRCPQGHEGRIWLDGRRKIGADGRFERTRWRCIPDEAAYAGRRQKWHGPGEHVFTTAMAHRCEPGDICRTCGRGYRRAEGQPTASGFSFSIPEIADAMVRAGRGDPYRRISQQLRDKLDKKSKRGEAGQETARNGALVEDYLDVFGTAIVEATSATSSRPAARGARGDRYPASRATARARPCGPRSSTRLRSSRRAASS